MNSCGCDLAPECCCGGYCMCHEDREPLDEMEPANE